MKMMIDVPKKIIVKFVDSNNDNIIRTLSSNKEYQVSTKDGRKIIGTILELTEDENPSLVFDIVMNPGFMHVMENNNCVIPVNDIENIETATSHYEKATRSIKELDSNIETFTFKFKTQKFPTPYKISVGAGEFVALSVAGKVVDGVPGKPISLYGEIISVDLEKFIIKFKRYISNKGARKIIETEVDINKLNGVYRQNLEVLCTTPEEDEVKSEEDTKKCECENCDGNCNCDE